MDELLFASDYLLNNKHKQHWTLANICSRALNLQKLILRCYSIICLPNDFFKNLYISHLVITSENSRKRKTIVTRDARKKATMPICEERRFDHNLKYSFKEQSTQQNQITPGYCPCVDSCSHKQKTPLSRANQVN